MDFFHTYELKRFDATQGPTWRGVRVGDYGVQEIQETYFSWVNPNFVKAWKRHKKATCNFVVPVGNVKFVMQTKTSVFQSVVIGVDNYVRLTVKPGVWFGFAAESDFPCLVVNSLDIVHDDEESENCDLNDFEYEWGSA